VPHPFVVVPFYNCENLLGRCLASLERQSVPATVVLIDDASAAPARDLARRWCEAGSERVYLSRERNDGPAAARHDGLSWVLERAPNETDVVVLLDGDDELAHERALETVLAVYERDRAIRMTLGGQRRQSGKAVYRRRYQRWHFDYGLTRATPWRAANPRSFQVGLLRKAWPSIRWRWPNGAWIRSGTDVLLLLPMLGELRWQELAQLEDILYVYNDVRPDGSTIESSARGRLWQLCTEAYVRRSLAWSLMALPRLAASAAHRRLRARANDRNPPARANTDG
jgi:glycosyltransferase involved in cell wall biosynthesis